MGAKENLGGRPPNMRDVAELAGVSQRTVSNVVNDYTHVSQRTRQRVLEAIDELGYRPNAVARSLRQGRTRVIALAVPNIAWPYFAEIAHLVQHETRARGYDLVVVETEGDARYERSVLEGFRTDLIDGLILSSIELGAEDLERMDLRIPLVLLGERIQAAGLPHFSIDNVEAAAQMTAHLLDLGARSFLVLGATDTVLTSSSGSLRLRGLLEELERHGAAAGGHGAGADGTARAGASGGAGDGRLGGAPDAGARLSGEAGVAGGAGGDVSWQICPVSPWTQEEAIEALTARPLDELPDAVFCMNDLLAFGAVRALTEMGVRVPDDVLVTGWDDVAMTRVVTPTLTTISPDKQAIAAGAVNALVDRIEGRKASSEDVLVPYRIVIRESTSRQS